VLYPIRDYNPRTRAPVVTLMLIGINVLVFLYELSLGVRARETLMLAGGAIPYEIVQGVDIGPRDLLPVPGSILTSMFLHGGWLHLVGNMWFLWIFGDNIEESLGSLRFVFFYFLAGTVGAVAQCYILPESLAPMIGASGAVAGILGGYVMLFPRARIITHLWIPFLGPEIHLPAWVFLGIWFLGQFTLPTGSGVAWMAHVGGFLAGVGAVRLLVRPPRSGARGPGSGDGLEVEYIPPRERRW
jgi:membrane associated rhomboid family serine protease